LDPACAKTGFEANIVAATRLAVICFNFMPISYKKH